VFFTLSEVSPVTGAFYRSAYALPVLLVLWWIRRGEDHRPGLRRWIAFGAGLALGLDVIAWHTSIEFIGAGLATLLANSSVIFVAVAAWVLQGEKPSRQVLIAIPFVLVGIGMVSGIGQQGAFGEDPLLGTALALLAAMLYAFFILGFRHSNDARAPAAGPLMEATAGALLMTLVFGLLGPGIEFGFSLPSHGWLLALGLGSQVVGWLLIGFALPRLPAVETATIILIQPALTLVWGALIFSERPSRVQILGALVVLAGVAFVAIARARATPEAVTARTT
jgi:drug/metabolite transporter (DMT)-like permease